MGCCLSTQQLGPPPPGEIHDQQIQAVYFERLIRKLLKPIGIDYRPKMEKITRRVGHVSGNYKNSFIVIWGGYNKHEVEESSYYEPDEVTLYIPLHENVVTMKTFGDSPKAASGATAVIHSNHFYLIGGFVRDFQSFPNPHVDDIYRLDLGTLMWQKLNPMLQNGPNFLKADKLSSWVYNDLIFIFGGFGFPPENAIGLPPTVSHVMATDVQFGLARGWNNQLVTYDIAQNSIAWPSVSGDIPSPRAAHATCCDKEEGLVYLFGGRFGNRRLNDLYVGYLKERGRVIWRRVEFPENIERDSLKYPCGRSWHSLTKISNHLLLYGGFDDDQNALNDCWMYHIQSRVWSKVAHLEKEPRLWHTAHYLPSMASVYLIGGVTRNIFLNHTNMHPENADQLLISPQSLYLLSLKVVAKKHKRFKDQIVFLPKPLQSQIRLRRNLI